MRKKQSVQRERFENDTFPHLDALWRTALWLTMRGSLADNLVLKTMTQAYLEWQDSGDLVSNKARLFRILTREFFGFGKQKQQRLQSTPFLSENVKAKESGEGRNPQNKMAAIKLSQLPRLAGISGVAVKGTIARLRPHSRLMLLLLYRERFSFGDIAYITNLSRNSVRTILTRLRAVILRYFIENANYIEEKAGSQSVFRADGAASNREHKNVRLNLPFIFP